ncbi:hypothetical protein Pen02_60460 [Plantactinospora endophytica]|uniref:HEAT repeat domain-containing protein n=2 Tax=Plantactinospora endophytica TaxID=673535 RepID=A0ABQ4E8P5_9ACTN|nr:hypothetical protein Pen02_60460 [Plantactinospora endophytica]
MADRRRSAELLVQLDESAGSVALIGLAQDRRLSYADRRWAIGALALVKADHVSKDARLELSTPPYNRQALQTIAKLNEHGTDMLLLRLAEDVGLDGVDRRWAAEALLESRHPRARSLLSRIANDKTLLSFDRELALDSIARLNRTGADTTPGQAVPVDASKNAPLARSLV